jgi:hypothetical protein
LEQQGLATVDGNRLAFTSAGEQFKEVLIGTMKQRT